ncbi:MAG: YeeE/YedE family [Beijerinckiaceae bacterium]|nr:MAG: YeeE/YedE family [Beijerinckiaceae bacterium]
MTPAQPAVSTDRRLIRAAPVLVVFALLSALALRHGGIVLLLLAAIGLGAGIALYHASFGFTAAWRRFMLERRSAGIRAQLVMLALASLVFFPLIAKGQAFGHPVGGFVFPIGWALILGAFVFGIGMQLGGGCGSGTLFTVGGGSLRMVVTLAFFIAGSTLATAYSDHWLSWPSLPPVSLIDRLGPTAGLGIMLGILALLLLAVGKAEKARHGGIQPIFGIKSRWLTGPWSLVAGAVALALVNIAVLLVYGWPWGITSAFALWGSKIAALAGFAPEAWAYWKGQEAALTNPVLADPTSVTDFGIILGAMLASILAGKFRPSLAIPLRSLLAAILGGLLLGVGARLGTGCNIGAFFSGTVSGSLHGWAWLIFAFAGNAVGIRLRPLFRLD